MQKLSFNPSKPEVHLNESGKVQFEAEHAKFPHAYFIPLHSEYF
jgi:hypothetical protein